jgi:adhesin transport system membrane fusion protein
MPNKVEYTENDYEFMHSLNAAILEKVPSKTSMVIKIWVITIFSFIIWASFAEIDEITRGSGDVIPSGENQIIQNLEGGIVQEILVSEGQRVKSGDIMLKINNIQSKSTYESNEIKIYELEAKMLRLNAESKGVSFKKIKKTNKIFSQFIELEYGLFMSNIQEQKAGDKSYKEKIIQKKQELKETKKRIGHLRKSLSLVSQEVKMTEPMVKEGIKSRVDFLKLKREYNEIELNLDSAIDSVPSINASIKEQDHQRKQDVLTMRNKAKKERNEVRAEIQRIKSNKTALSDKVNRTDVRSPVDGIIKKLFAQKDGVIQPGQDIVEIVPTDDNLLLEIKIKPSDIAFIHPDADAIVKFSAYDFAIYGSLDGKIVRISPDTITDEKDNTFYLIYIKTAKSYLGPESAPLSIIPGMMVDVDIVTGKKTIMQYILKPILKSKQYIFSER